LLHALLIIIGKFPSERFLRIDAASLRIRCVMRNSEDLF
jgi:hypothetical protein